ncbi:MAG: ATP-binding protein [Sporichthyaceae bacterium]
MADVAPTAEVRYGLLGPVEAYVGGVVLDVGGPGQRALLAVLLLNRGSVVTPDRLIDALWGDAPPATALSTLRGRVARLRAELVAAGEREDVLRWRDLGYVLDVDRERIDVGCFDELIARARELTSNDPEAAADLLRQALELWRGPAIVEFADREFARLEARRLGEARSDATEELAAAELAAGRPASALEHLVPHVAAHPLRERAWELRMRALYALGRQAEALAAYRELRGLLDEQLGVEPSPALRELEVLILRQDRSLSSIGQLPPAEPSSATAGFVGRDAELQVLARAARRAAAGSGELLLIGGEPGIGKTRLAQQAAALGTALGLDFYTGHCQESSGAPPYLAVIEVLEQALSRWSSARAFRTDVLAETAPEIARLVPRLRRLYPDLADPLELPAEQEQRYLLTCLVECVERLAEHRPAMLLLDDLQWADERTLALVEHLADHLPRAGLLVVATYRDSEPTPRLERLLADLHRHRRAERIRLGPLDREETAEFLGVLAGREVSSQVAAEVYARTEGHPFFTEEVFRDLADRRPPADVPEGIRALLERRLDRLAPATRTVLDAAAVAGPTFPFRLVRRLVDLSEDAVLDALDEARRAALIVDGGDEFLFAHDLIRQALLAGLSSARRRRAHHRTAEAMAEVFADEFDEHAAEMVHQLDAADDEANPKDLWWALSRAGRRALDTSAFEEAAAHLERAADLLHVADPSARGDFLFALGTARQTIGRWEPALAAWDAALAEFESAGDVESVGRVCISGGLALVWGNRVPDAFGLMARGLAGLGDRVSPSRAELIARLTSIQLYVDPATAAPQVDLVHALLDALDSDRVRGAALGELCAGFQGSMQFSEGVAVGRAALPLLAGSGNLWGEAYAGCFLEYNLLHSGRFAESAQIGEHVARIAGRTGNAMAAYAHLRASGMREWFASGDPTVCARHGQADLEFAQGLGWTWWTGHSHAWLALSRHLVGDLDGAEEAYATALAHTDATLLGGFVWGARLHFLAATGRAEEAVEFLAAHVEHLPVAGRANTWTSWALLFAAVEALDLLGDRERVGAWYPLVREACATGAVVTDYIGGRLLERVLGIAAAAAGDGDAAERHFRAAIDWADRLPHPLEGLRARRGVAALYEEQVRFAEAARLRAEADAEAVRLGVAVATRAID